MVVNVRKAWSTKLCYRRFMRLGRCVKGCPIRTKSCGRRRCIGRRWRLTMVMIMVNMLLVVVGNMVIQETFEVV